MSHTPGPWRIDWRYTDHRPGFPACLDTCGKGKTPDRITRDEKGELHGYLFGPGDILGGGESAQHVVCFGHDYDEYGGILDVGDAHLIAAAPELLAIVERFGEMYERGDPVAYYQDGTLKAATQAALAKVRGEQT